MLYLFERISVRPRGSDGKPEAFDEAAAAAAQVQRIASTWRNAGATVAVVPWGMQAVTTLGASATVQLEAYAQKLGEAIARHEPRLKSVRVSVEPRDDALSPYGLVINASFPGEEQPRNVRVAAPY
jgi:predicted component of type VI protein secretion system